MSLRFHGHLKAPEDWRSVKRFAHSRPVRAGASFWTAPVLWRFGKDDSDLSLSSYRSDWLVIPLTRIGKKPAILRGLLRYTVGHETMDQRLYCAAKGGLGRHSGGRGGTAHSNPPPGLA